MKKWLNIQITKMKNIAMIGSLILLALNLAFTIYPYIAWRKIHPYLGISILFFGIILLIWIISHIWMNYLEMYKTQRLAETVLYNPYQVYAFAPFEEMIWRTFHIPMLEAIAKMHPDDNERKRLGELLKKVKKWVNLGYIPKEDFPNHLKKYYMTNKEGKI